VVDGVGVGVVDATDVAVGDGVGEAVAAEVTLGVGVGCGVLVGLAVLTVGRGVGAGVAVQAPHVVRRAAAATRRTINTTHTVGNTA
jgi:hypothetical protein